MVSGFEPDDVDARTIYRTLVGTVVPRPIGWISTVDSNGTENIAPFSFFGVACVDPPMVHFTQGMRANGRYKDTGNNIRDTGEFVHNMVTEQTLKAMHQSSATFESDVSEFEMCDIETVPAEVVTPPRVAASPVSLECTLHQALELGSHALFIGRIERIHIDESVMTDGKIDIDCIDPIGRLTAGRYLSLDSQLILDSVKDKTFAEDRVD